MTIFDEMEAKKGSFTKADNQIYATIKKFPDDVATNRINDIVGIFNISQPALTRFAKKMGYSGFTEFQFAYKNDLQKLKQNPEKTYAQQYADLFESIENSLSKETLHNLAEHMLQSRIVYTAGSSIARIPCSYIFSISQITNAFTSIQCETHEIPSHMKKNDMFLLFSAYSGSVFKNSIDRMNNQEEIPYKVLVTFNPKHPLRKDFDTVIILPALHSEGKGSSAPAEPISFLFFINMLSDEISKIVRSKRQSN